MPIKVVCTLLALAIGFAAGTARAAGVTSAVPQGSVREVREVREIVLRFDSPMVALGDLRAPAPASVSCAAAGQGRWIDDRRWVYHFDSPLPAGLRCEYTLSAGLRTLAGIPLKAGPAFAFDTGGPGVLRSLPEDGSEGIDAETLFALALDAPATRASIEAQASCAVENLAERIGVRVIEGEARTQWFAQRRELGYRYRALLVEGDEDAWTELPDATLRAREARVALVQCARPLPDRTGVDLVWGRGIATAGGATTARDQVLKFRTRAAFTATLSCERLQPQAGCVPLLPLRLRFSAPVPVALAQAVRIEAPGLSRAPRRLDAAERVADGIEFAGPFPESATLRVVLPAGFVDDAGRALANAGSFPLSVSTDAAPPLAKFSGEFGILERQQGGVLPLTLRDLEAPLPARHLGGRSLRIDDEASILVWMQRVRRAMNPRWENEQTIAPGAESVFAVPPALPGGAAPAPADFAIDRPAGAKAFEVIGLPLRDPGFHVVEIASPQLGAALLGPGRTRYVATTALVTDLAVHFKWGREGSLAFVTSLQTGKPVAGASVRVLDGCDARAFWDGRTDASGIARIDRALPKPQTWTSCDSDDSHPLMVSARTGDDFAFTLSSWNEGIQPYDFNLDVGLWQAPTTAHTVLDRSLFRAGETVSMKHFWREHGAGGLRVPAQSPTRLVIEAIGGEPRVELPLSFDTQGIATSEWKIPESARLGEYRLRFEGENLSVDSGSFRVEQYRLPLMRALVSPPAEPAIAAKELPLDVYVGYLSGGGAAGLDVRLRSQVQPREPRFAAYEQWRFDGEPIRTGITENEGEDDGTRPAAGTARLQPLRLDAQGSAHAVIDALPASAQAQTLVTELEYPDANGQIASVRSSVALWPAAVVVGLGPTATTRAEAPFNASTVVLDLHGRPVANRPVELQFYVRETHGYRKRLVGGYYAYSSSTQTRKLSRRCNGRSDAQGQFRCSLQLGASGNILIEATARDEQGRTARATTSAWIVGSDEDWFVQGDSDRMDVVPESRQLAPGQKLRLRVESPFRHATALVSVEREGVIDAFVTEISGRHPVIEVPMLDRYAPNVYVSVLALRPRVNDFRSRLASFLRWLGLDRWIALEGGNPTATVDLSKPAYRLGMTAVDVGWNAHRLLVHVKPAQDRYATRETAQVDIEVRSADGKPLPMPAEIAFSAVDEALLDLLPNPSVDLLDAMMQRRGIEVLTATAQMQVVGKRHYGRKSAPPGGGGGRGAPRELLNSLLSWQARVPLDAQGRARVAVPLNDALSAFRFTAVASAGPDRFGEGHASVRTTQDVQLLSGLPPVVRGGDAYTATFTLRNTGSRAQTVHFEATAAAAGHELPVPAAQTLTLEANSALPVHVPVRVPAGLAESARELVWTLGARDAQGRTLDALRVKQGLLPAIPVRVQQATLLSIDGRASVPVAAPADALRPAPGAPASGGVRVALSESLAGSLAGVSEWMRDYPYSCTEQLASRAIATGRRDDWDALMRRLPTLLDRNGLARFFAVDGLDGDVVLTAYLLQIAQASGWAVPEDTRERLLEALAGYASGRLRDGRDGSQGVTLARKLVAIEALARYGRAEAAWLDALDVEASRLAPASLIDWIGILQRVDGIGDGDRLRAAAAQQLRLQLDVRGSSLGFSAARDADTLPLLSSADATLNRAILALLDEAGWKDELPALVRGAVARQQRGHWDITTANAWGTLALQGFATRYESRRVSGDTVLALGTATHDYAWPAGNARIEPAPIDLPWPLEAGTLSLSHTGDGKPWALVQTRAALPLAAPLSAGYTLRRSVTAIERRHPDRWSVGDVLRVRLDVDASADMNWVVIDDPVPAGATIVGTLGRDSALLAAGEQRSGAALPLFEERRFEAYRAYFEHLPRGQASVEYTLRLNTAGRFELPSSRVEALYAPEMFAERPNTALDVGE